MNARLVTAMGLVGGIFSLAGAVPAATQGAGCATAQFSGMIPVDLANREIANILAVCSMSRGDRTVGATGVGFDGPPVGLLFITEREKIVGNGLRIGKPISITTRTLKNGKTLLTLEATIGTGTGVREDRFSIYSIDPGKPSLLWSGLAYRHEFVDGETGVTLRASLSIQDGDDGKSIDIDYALVETREAANRMPPAQPKVHLERKHVPLP